MREESAVLLPSSGSGWTGHVRSGIGLTHRSSRCRSACARSCSASASPTSIATPSVFRMWLRCTGHFYRPAHAGGERSLFSTSEGDWIFVMSAARVLFCNRKRKASFHHTSFSGGGPCLQRAS